MKTKVFLMVLCVFASPLIADAGYTIQLLPSLPNSGQDYALGINHSGQVVGYSLVSDGYRACLWENGVIHDLGAFGYNANGNLVNINDSGQAIGSVEYPYGQGTDFCVIWQNSQVINFSPEFFVSNINNSGKVVGSLNGHAITWQDGVISNLGELPGCLESYAYSINNLGHVVGCQWYNNGPLPCLWKDGAIVDLGSLGGVGQPWSINDNGQVVGGSRSPNGYHHAFLWENGIMRDLAPESFQSNALSINDLGQIVGNISDSPSSGERGFLWQDGKMVDLYSLISEISGWTKLSAMDINNYGQIAGRGMYGGRLRAFVMTPIPEPNTLLLLGMGGEILTGGDTYTINWSSTGLISSVLIEYSANNGGTWNDVSAVPNTGSYNWLVPAINSNQCLVRVSDDSNPAIYDISDNAFVIYDWMLSVIRPNGGERISKGSDYDVLWSSDLSGRSVVIEYSADSGGTWQNIATTDDTGSYQWHVAGPESGDYLIRISDANGCPVSDTSDNSFAVYACQEQIAGDLNGDCVVNLIDYAIIAESWLKKGNVIIYSLPLDTMPTWEMEGQWQFGQPTGSGGTEYGNPDPTSGYTGSNVYGMNLNGDYTIAAGGPYTLTAGPFNCSQFNDIKLRFARWLNTDEPDYVICRVEASNNGTNWNVLWENTAAVTDSSWQVVEYDVSVIADNKATVYFRWSYEILDGRAYPYSGWNIDDVELLGKL